MALSTTSTVTVTAIATATSPLDKNVPGKPQCTFPKSQNPALPVQKGEEDKSQQQAPSRSASVHNASTLNVITRSYRPADPYEVDLDGGEIMPGPPPDGGIQAWLQVLVAHLVIFNTWGYINSFGVFQTYYIGALGQSPSNISWIGAVQVFLLFFIGTFSGRATDAGYFRHAFILGTIFILLGIFMTSICTNYWQLFLAQGVCTGIGNGLLFCPTLALIPTYFAKNRAMAVGLAASGTTTGGMIIPGIFEGLLPRLKIPILFGYIIFGWPV